MSLNNNRKSRAIAASQEGVLTLDFEGRLLAVGTHYKLNAFAFTPSFHFIAICKTKHAMTAYSITTVGSASPIVALRRELHILTLMLNSIVAERHPALPKLGCTHAVPIIGDGQCILLFSWNCNAHI